MPKILPIITNPNPILRRQSADVKQEIISSSEMLSFYEDMILTMQKKDGVGLAAPQVAQNIRVVVINSKHGILVMINPQITKKSWARKKDEEGCLSVPRVFGIVSRHKRVSVTYTSPDGKSHKLEANDLLARIIQHEMDHLDGILFIDKAEKIAEQKD